MLALTKTVKQFKITIIDRERYNLHYETIIKDNYEKYTQFLKNKEIWSDNTQFTEDDVITLISIDENQEQGSFADKTRRQVAVMFQKEIDKTKEKRLGGSKYLDGKDALVKAICKINGIKELCGDSEGSQDFVHVVKCGKGKKRKTILLCENIDRLKAPKFAKENCIELWYAGGNNTKKLIDWVEEADVPIFYFCDWDRAGLTIYERIKDIFISEKKDITLITSDTNYTKTVFIEKHDDRWTMKPDVNLLSTYYTKEQIDLIKTLKEKDEWIEEEDHESNPFNAILRHYKLIS